MGKPVTIMANGEPPSQSFEVDFPSKAPIACSTTTPSEFKPKAGSQSPPSLIFTHGAGGTLASAAMQNFTAGFARVSSVTSFQGMMNLASRTNMFGAVISHHGMAARNSLGGRSMGARAAVNAATEGTTHLVLVSYPLHTDAQVRDEILVSIPSRIKVIFVSGDRDHMCELSRLGAVRKRMQARSWQIVVKGADHGMEVTPRKATTESGKASGEAVARWLLESDDKLTEGEVFWDEKAGNVIWSGWLKADEAADVQPSNSSGTSKNPKGGKARVKSKSEPKISNSKVVKRKSNASDEAGAETRRSARIKKKKM